MGLFDKLFKRQLKPGTPRPIGDDNFEPSVHAPEEPSVLLFYSNTCSSCHVMTGLVKELGPEFVGKVNFFTMNVNFARETSRLYQIQSVPTILIFSNGRVRDKIVGLAQMDELRERVERWSAKVRV